MVKRSVDYKDAYLIIATRLTAELILLVAFQADSPYEWERDDDEEDIDSNYISI